jgi:hypothetical protein
MLKKIRSLVSNYDKRFFAWLEGESSSRSKRQRQTSEDTNARSQVSDRRMVPPSNEIQIPDPWD